MSDNKFDINSVIDEVKRIATEPVEYYKTMKTSGGFTDPIIFVVVMGAVSGLLASVFALIAIGRFGMMAMGIGSIIIVPIFVLIACFIGAAIMYVIWKLMGSEQNYETAFRCVASTTVIMPLMIILPIIPYLGNIIAVGLSFFLIYLATIHVHKIEEGKAKIVIGVIAALVILSNLSGERFQRNMTAKMDSFSEQLDFEGKTPEEMGEAVGKFLKGLEEAAKEDNQK
jgi:hypothetical protein